MKIGDRVKVVRVPSVVNDQEGFPTRTLLSQCIGRVFPVAGFQHIDGIADDLLELEVGEVVGKRSWAETIWIEPDCVELVDSNS